MNQDKFAYSDLLIVLIMTVMVSPIPAYAKSTMPFSESGLHQALSNSQTQSLFLVDALKLSERKDDKGGGQQHRRPTNFGGSGKRPAVQGVLDDFFTLDERPDDKGGARGDSFCPIAPFSPNVKPRIDTFLSDRPTFVWEGEAVRIEVRPLGEDTAVWGKDLQPNARTAAYPTDQPALLPNKTYKLWFKLASGATYDDVTFSVLSADQRQPVQLALQQLVNQMPANQKSDKRAIAAQQAIYLGKQKLWLDAYSVLFSVPQSDVLPQERANWNKGIEAIRQSVCKPPK